MALALCRRVASATLRRAATRTTGRLWRPHATARVMSSASTNSPTTAATAAAAAAAQAAPFVSRRVAQSTESAAQSEGQGAVVRRSIGTEQLRYFDPFLMLDEFYVAHETGVGFPDHPHRGFETVTYMLRGAFEHEDFCGHRGRLQAGDVQWMTAGRGIVHSEMPARLNTRSLQTARNTVSHGLQLWVNLRAADKLCEPAYQELKSADMPKPTSADGLIDATVIAGSALGASARVVTRTPTTYVHFRLRPGAVLHQPIVPTHNAFVYVLHGSAMFGGDGVPRAAHHALTLTRNPTPPAADAHQSQPQQQQQQQQTGLVVQALARAPSTMTSGAAVTVVPPPPVGRPDYMDDVPPAAKQVVPPSEFACEFVLLTGEPLGERVASYGPFVMTSEREIHEAVADFRASRNGFERAKGWRSTIGKPITDKW